MWDVCFRNNFGVHIYHVSAVQKELRRNFHEKRMLNEGMQGILHAKDEEVQNQLHRHKGGLPKKNGRKQQENPGH